MITKRGLTVLLVLAMVLTACVTPSSAQPVSEASTDPAPAIENLAEEALPPENIGGATLEWLGDPQNATMAIIGVGGFAAATDAIGFWPDDVVAVVVIAGIGMYAVSRNPDLISQGAEAVVEGAEGVRNWIRSNISISVPIAFSPDEGEVEIRAPGINFTATWKKNDSGIGCNYNGSLNGISLKPLETTDPCHPDDFLAFVASQLDSLQKQVGQRADELMRALMDIIGPFAR